MTTCCLGHNFGIRKHAIQLSGATKDVVLEKALSRYLAELKEDAEDAMCAEKAWNDFEKSGEKTYTIAEMRHELGL